MGAGLCTLGGVSGWPARVGPGVLVDGEEEAVLTAELRGVP